MKKGFSRGILSFFLLILISAVVSAANSTTGSDLSSSSDAVNKAYDCLKSVTDKPVSSLSLQEAIFATLALGYKKNLSDRIENDKSTTEWCWPKAGCIIKDTAQAALAYKRSGKSNENILKWLSSKNGTSNDLVWYLEIDIANHGPAECKLKYDNDERKINILEDMKIYGSPGNCFSVSASGYWLTERESCYGKDIQISCDQDFVTTLLYQRKTGGTVYVMPDTHSAAALGSTNEKIDVRCFKTGSKCDYEGSLWAALIMQKEGKSISQFLPYLVAMTEDNEKYFPSAFLFALTGADDQYDDIIQSQKQSRSWKMVSTPYNEFYDTSLALLALTRNADADNVRSYLLSIQTKEGCWNNNNIRDTAFLLFAGWQKEGSSGGGGGGTTPLCEAIATQSCEVASDCTSTPNGTILNNFGGCGFKQCCSVKVPKQTCAEQNGEKCNDNQDCDGSFVVSSDSDKCCLGDCVAKQNPFTCEIDSDKSCRGECNKDEQESLDGTCETGSVCCEPATDEGGSSYWWIYILIILIILIVVAIIFKDRLLVTWYKFKGKAKSSPVVRPAVPPTSMNTVPIRPQPQFRTSLSPRYGSSQATVRMPTRAPSRPASSKDKEFEDTLKKLRDMSK